MINQLLVSCFLDIKNYEVRHNDFLLRYKIQETAGEFKKYVDLIAYIHKNKIPFDDIEDLIEYFEFVISPEDKVVNGAVYTPKIIRDFIIEATFKTIEVPLDKVLIGDITCGCGCFLYSAALELYRKTNKSFYNIFRENIFGLDITAYSVERTKIILSILAIENQEDTSFDFNLFVGNALDFNWADHAESVQKNKGFDVIVGNPPYVSSKKISEESKNLLSKWNVSQFGNTNLYIPFFQIGIENLAPKGILGYITVNSFIRSANGKLIRQYFHEKSLKIGIYDFGDIQIFKNHTTYTCICLIQNVKSKTIGFTKVAAIKQLSHQSLNQIPYKTLTPLKGWHLGTDTILNHIQKIESVGAPLGQIAQIKNGFATLKNDIYLFSPIAIDQQYYQMQFDDKLYSIEKEICREAIKTNILRQDSDVQKHKEKIIFPYERVEQGQQALFGKKNSELRLIDENVFSKKYPNAYAYLTEQKVVLSQRDKGKKIYENWYAFGRNQALMIKGYKLFFPSYSNRACFTLSEDKDLLFYNGYAIVSDDLLELKFLQKVLNSGVFWYYIRHTSKPYTHDYFSLAKNLIQNFGVCECSEMQKKALIDLTDPKEIDDFLFQMYDLCLEPVPKKANIAKKEPK
jgi:methylase of polypeptide subunit release factors